VKEKPDNKFYIAWIIKNPILLEVEFDEFSKKE
jgi:hypothetical protein